MTDQLVKVLLLLPRKKENEEIATEKMQHRKCFRKVWATPEEREVRIKELEAVASLYPEYKWRIYETVNWRDLKKAYFGFMARVLEWQRNDTGDMAWVQHFNSEWVSNLMRPESRYKQDTLWLIDKDDKKDIEELQENLRFLDIRVTEEYETVNGMHYLVEPFNINLLYRDLVIKNAVRQNYTGFITINIGGTLTYDEKFLNDAIKNYGHTLLKTIYNAEIHKDGLRLVKVIEKGL